jgi:hypothetical protein
MSESEMLGYKLRWVAPGTSEIAASVNPCPRIEEIGAYAIDVWGNGVSRILFLPADRSHWYEHLCTCVAGIHGSETSGLPLFAKTVA